MIAHIINNKSDWCKFQAYYGEMDLRWIGSGTSFWYRPISIGYGLLLEPTTENGIYKVSYSDNYGHYIKRVFPECIKPIPVRLTPLQVFERFLKHHRKYSWYIRNEGLAFIEPDLRVENYVAAMAFIDTTAKELNQWDDLHRKWIELVQTLNLQEITHD